MTGFVLQILFINGVGAARVSLTRQHSVDPSTLTTEEKQRGVGQQMASGHKPFDMPVFDTGVEGPREAPFTRHQNSNSGSGSPPRLQYPIGESRNEKLKRALERFASTNEEEQNKKQKSYQSAASNFGTPGSSGGGFLSDRNSNYNSYGDQAESRKAVYSAM